MLFVGSRSVATRTFTSSICWVFLLSNKLPQKSSLENKSQISQEIPRHKKTSTKAPFHQRRLLLNYSHFHSESELRAKQLLEASERPGTPHCTRGGGGTRCGPPTPHSPPPLPPQGHLLVRARLEKLLRAAICLCPYTCADIGY